MIQRLLIAAALPALLFSAELDNAPKLPHKLVKNWAQLPPGWNFGETSGVSVDKNDNVWVFNRGPHPVIQFDKTGKMLQAWKEVPIVSSHGIRVDPEGFVWLVDVAGHQLIKMTSSGRVVMRIGGVGGAPGNDETKEAFNRPTGIIFAPNGDFFLSDGYINSRVVKYNKDGDFLTKWGRKGTGDGEFNLVHDVALDSKGKLYVADRTNSRIQIFDQNGTFLGKWTNVGQPWGLTYYAKEDALYMCDGINDRIVKLDLNGNVLGTLSSHGKDPGRLDFPHNIAVDSTGAIYVAEIKNWRVQKFAK